MKFAFMSVGVTSGIIATAVTVTVVAIMVKYVILFKKWRK